ncbi:MAG: Eco57I restriction-modification methylase domain-containing protein [Betaproteobacteria bacterium]|nr:Eco57I restriction-modification methylase domain-containing protein [Betaproteobacteria bacterium]
MMLDQVRLEVSAKLDRSHRSAFGQFMTPSSVARFMANLFPASPHKTARLLDAGAGVGSLLGAFLDRWGQGEFPFQHVEVTAYEIDDTLRKRLSHTLAHYAEQLDIRTEVLGADFIEDAVNRIQFQDSRRFTHAILNPPYKKIASRSRHRLLLRQIGIETVNLYTAFVALAVAQMVPGGQIVAIIPRSFCNGPYYKPFRDFILERAAIRHIHLFAARDKAFKDDAVLQENVILLLECGGKQGEVIVSTSMDDSFADYATHTHPFERIVFPADPERFIHIPTDPEQAAFELAPAFSSTLSDIGVEVATGPVVDFRMKEHLRDMPEAGSIPLIYPTHFTGQSIEWPKPGAKKPNALMLNADTKKWLYPNGYYAVVRRFSSKEEKRRIVASLVSPDAFDTRHLGFENHLNVFHHAKQGLPEDLARGLAAYLNTTMIDEYFRRFSGHTQVNATDLRRLKYPSRDALIKLGRWAVAHPTMTQEQLDNKIESMA